MSIDSDKRPPRKRLRPPALRKTPTGVTGLDEITGGGRTSPCRLVLNA